VQKDCSKKSCNNILDLLLLLSYKTTKKTFWRENQREKIMKTTKKEKNIDNERKKVES